ncbi:sigma-70 family RNA polymerase sigma factor [Patulibacter sp. SYSU D01012]|uniref:RNA polymerase sigma factor n=1 Tax=Patulibacter sp. SYSU D01012 TaxID=2817381 RepID=UPI001B311A01|nr:sigma-70 family RNA polymerase sigma factor [Patulibacter sp. SYSU D01012]
MARVEPPSPAPPGSAAFAEVFAAYLPPIVRYLRRRLGDAAAEDAAAEVFLRAFRMRERYEPRTATPLPWLYAIATRVVAEEHRHERRRLRTLERLAGQRRSLGDDPADRLETDPRLIRAVRRLPPADREALLLVAWGELSGAEAAAALGVPAATVRTRLLRARRQIDAALRNDPAVHDLHPATGEHHG